MRIYSLLKEQFQKVVLVAVKNRILFFFFRQCITLLFEAVPYY